MHVLLVGGGGREHALCWAIARSPLLGRLSVTHDNPGFPEWAVRAEGDPVAWSEAHGVDLVVVGPEAPLAEGLVDRLHERGIPACGPRAAAARLEASKSFAKAFMDRHGIPTARWSTHADRESAHAAVSGPCVVKADGLAAGKGVVVAGSAGEARAAIDAILGGRFGAAGGRVLVEERLTGPEVSVIALCDGRRAVPLLPCRDHKRRFEGDQGPNTGGMGAFCPVPDVSAAFVEEVRRTVLQPVVDGMAAEGTPFRGVLYAGLMRTPDGPRVLEFNVRFGDPECQPLVMMLDEDLLPLLLEAARGELPERPLRWRSGAACCVVMVRRAYPGSDPGDGPPIAGIPEPSEELAVFQAGTSRLADGGVGASGGRVLGVTAWGPSLDQARALAYEALGRIRFEGASWRRDVGGPALPGSPLPPEVTR